MPDNSRGQHHVSLAIAYELWQYHQVSSDDDFLIDYGRLAHGDRPVLDRPRRTRPGDWRALPLIAAGLDLAPHLTFGAMRAGVAGAALVALGLISGRAWPTSPESWLLVATAGSGRRVWGSSACSTPPNT